MVGHKKYGSISAKSSIKSKEHLLTQLYLLKLYKIKKTGICNKRGRHPPIGFGTLCFYVQPSLPLIVFVYHLIFVFWIFFILC